MITNSDITLRLAVLTKDDYENFSKYCILLDKGLRKDALKSLDLFIDSTNNWDSKKKETFISLLFTSSKTHNDLSAILTTNLSDKLVKPTLSEMMLNQPKNYLPFKWFGEYYQDTLSLKKAYELNHSDNTLKLALLARLENDLWHSTHHLPENYLGEFIDDINDLELAFNLLNTTEGIVNIDNYKNKFLDYKQKIESYIKE